MKKYKKYTLEFVKTGTTMGVGSRVLSGVGSTGGTQAVGRLSSTMPAVGTIRGAGMLFGSLNTLKKSTRKRR